MSDIKASMTQINKNVGQVAKQQTPLAVYRQRVASGELNDDPDQKRVLTRLDKLWHELLAMPDRLPPLPPPKKGGHKFFQDIARYLKLQAPEPQIPYPRGLYIVGRVGRGKTMVMDLFYACAPVNRKQRLHFFHFMQEVHKKLYELKRAHPDMADPIPPLADSIAERATLLCFDEFQINDIADAMILGRLFEALFARKVVVVATSNTEPSQLFQNRPGADAFKPFIAIIRREMDIVELDSPRDYRRGRNQDKQTWLVPADEVARHTLDEIFARFAGDSHAESVTLEFSGRSLEVNMAAGPVCRFDFNSLCAKPLGPNDYLALAKRFPVVIIEGIPCMGPDDVNTAYRFITIVDALYDNGNLLFASAEAVPDKLFTEGEVADAFMRTASRLVEMGSKSWLEHGAEAARRAHSY